MGCPRLEYLQDPTVVVCRKCRNHLTIPDNLISKEFQGQHGRAHLYAEVVNIHEDKPIQRFMTTGEHVVCDISCRACQTKLGWKYIRAFPQDQRYKMGHYILERNLIEDAPNKSII